MDRDLQELERRIRDFQAGRIRSPRQAFARAIDVIFTAAALLVIVMAIAIAVLVARRIFLFLIYGGGA